MKVILKITILFTFFTTSSIFAFGQKSVLMPVKKKYTMKLVNPIFQLPDSISSKATMKLPAFSVDKLPIFCKFEERATQSSKINLRVRLGSLDYVDKLEGKTHY